MLVLSHLLPLPLPASCSACFPARLWGYRRPRPRDAGSREALGGDGSRRSAGLKPDRPPPSPPSPPWPSNTTCSFACCSSGTPAWARPACCAASPTTSSTLRTSPPSVLGGAGGRKEVGCGDPGWTGLGSLSAASVQLETADKGIRRAEREGAWAAYSPCNMPFLDDGRWLRLDLIHSSRDLIRGGQAGGVGASHGKPLRLWRGLSHDCICTAASHNLELGRLWGGGGRLQTWESDTRGRAACHF